MKVLRTVTRVVTTIMCMAANTSEFGATDHLKMSRVKERSFWHWKGKGEGICRTGHLWHANLRGSRGDGLAATPLRTARWQPLEKKGQRGTNPAKHQAPSILTDFSGRVGQLAPCRVRS